MKKYLLKIKVFACSASLLMPLVSADNYKAGETKAVIEHESSYYNREAEIETAYTTTTTQPVTPTKKVIVGYREEKYISGYIEEQYIKGYTTECVKTDSERNQEDTNTNTTYQNVPIYDVKKIPVYSTRLIPIYEEVTYSFYSKGQYFDCSSETVCTTTEPVDEYKHIRNLETLKNNDLSIEELDSFIAKYANYSKLSYDDALKVINDNIDTIEKEYESIRGGIMCTLFEYSKDNNILSVYTEDREKRLDMTQEEKERIMIEYCDNLCMCNDDKYIVISAFREETGRGISDMCVYNNNYGGIKVYNGEYGRFSTPEFGIYYEVGLINYKLKNIREQGINDINSVVYQFACRYNPDYADHYSVKILNWVYDVQNDYGDFTNVNSKQKVYNN